MQLNLAMMIGGKSLTGDTGRTGSEVSSDFAALMAAEQDQSAASTPAAKNFRSNEAVSLPNQEQPPATDQNADEILAQSGVLQGPRWSNELQPKSEDGIELAATDAANELIAGAQGEASAEEQAGAEAPETAEDQVDKSSARSAASLYNIAVKRAGAEEARQLSGDEEGGAKLSAENVATAEDAVAEAAQLQDAKLAAVPENASAQTSLVAERADLAKRIPSTPSASGSGVAAGRDGEIASAGLTKSGSNVSDRPVVSANGAQSADIRAQANGTPELTAQQTGLEEEQDFSDLLTDIADEATQVQAHRTDARTVEAAAQNAVRQTSSSHLAAMVSRVGEQILQRYNGKTSTFEIRLDPPELGKVDVRVEVGADGKVMAVLAARDPSVAEALMRGAKTLENALTQAGISLSEEGISVQLEQDNTSGSSGTAGENDASKFSEAFVSEGEPLAEAGDNMPITPVIQTWSRHRLDLTA